MAQKKPSKIIFCHYNHPKVEELAEWYNGKLPQATLSCRLHNDNIVATGQTLQDAFYFLNTTIAGETHIITAAGRRDYPSNDPYIVAKLEAYLASKGTSDSGSAHKRGTVQAFDPARADHVALDKKSFYRHYVPDEKTGEKVVLELKIIYRAWLDVSYYTYNGKPAVRVTSLYLTVEQIKDAIDQILAAR